jgi:hypothetical protein
MPPRLNPVGAGRTLKSVPDAVKSDCCLIDGTERNRGRVKPADEGILAGSANRLEKLFAGGKAIAIEEYVKDFARRVWDDVYEFEINGCWINTGDDSFACEGARRPEIRRHDMPSMQRNLS